MSDLDDGVERLKEILTDQVNKLDSLHREGFVGPLLQEYYYELILTTLFHANTIEPNISHLDITEQKKLSRMCIEIVNSREPIKSGRSRGNRILSRKILAVKIITLIVKEPFNETYSRDILRDFYFSLGTNLRVEEISLYGDAARKYVELKGLLAYCLSQKSFEKIISPNKAYSLIENQILELTTWCFAVETDWHKECAFDQFKDNFHGLSHHNNLEPIRQYKHTYPLLVHLLLSLMRLSDGCPSGGYREKFYLMLENAWECREVGDEDVVALNVIMAERDEATIEQYAREIIGLTIIGEKFHRCHIVYMLWKQFSPVRGLFALHILDDFFWVDDELLDEILLNSLGELQYTIDWSQFAGDFLSHIEILRKLLSISSEPKIFSMFPKYYIHPKDLPSQIEFDRLAQVPISNIINRVHYLMMLKQRDNDQKCQLGQYLGCLENSLRLHRLRLEPDKEVKLIEVFDLLTNDEFSNYRSPAYGILLVFANRYEVYPSAWASIIKLIHQFVKQTVTIHVLEDTSAPELMFIPKAISMTLSHLLMTDSDKFYEEFGSLETLEIIYEYCRQAVESPGSMNTLLKEILLTWPDGSEKTELNSTENRDMINKFIELLVNALEKAKNRYSTQESHTNGFFDLLSGLVVAFSRHRKCLHDILDSSSLGHQPEVRDMRLKDNISNWTRLMIDSIASVDTSEGTIEENYRGLNEFANIFVAYEGLVMLKRDFYECSAFTESYETLLNVVKSALDASIKQAPVNSIEKTKYLQIRANLSADHEELTIQDIRCLFSEHVVSLEQVRE